MLEMLVGGGGKPYYPKSGPGPKTLQYGNDQAGYFGTLTQSQLFTPTELYNQLNIPLLGPSTDATMLWGKFYYRGAVVYLPTRPLNTPPQAFNWEMLYQMGLVYGTDNDGPFPSPVGSPYNQRTLVVKKLEGKVAGFKVKLPAAGSKDPLAAGTSTTGELGELLANILAIGVGSGSGKWDSLDPTVVNLNVGFMTQSSITGVTANTAYSRWINNQPNSFTVAGYSKTSYSVSVLWWPVLEYINPDEHQLDLINFTVTQAAPAAVDMVQNTGESTGGILGVYDVKASFTSKAPNVTATTTGLLGPSAITAAPMGPVPRFTRVTTDPLSGPGNITLSNTAKAPSGNVTNVMTVFNPFAPTITYDPKPLTGLKLADQ